VKTPTSWSAPSVGISLLPSRLLLGQMAKSLLSAFSVDELAQRVQLVKVPLAMVDDLPKSCSARGSPGDVC